MTDLQQLKQEAFTKAYLGLASQGFKHSMQQGSGQCLYRGPDNTKCAIGSLKLSTTVTNLQHHQSMRMY